MTDPPKNDRSALQAAALRWRLAAMVYEAVLLFGVTSAVGFALLASMQWSYPLTTVARATLQGALFITAGAYLVFCWTRGGQTLALKAWRLKVVTDQDRPPGIERAIGRYLLAWHLWLPALALSAIFDLSVTWTAFALAASFGLLLLPAARDPKRRLLHDRWTGTRVVRAP
ncbi:MAG: RDD family protein [Burkholderiaceae bacterium]|nr:RDD family protein [Burkholderiaceae bacterium]